MAAIYFAVSSLVTSSGVRSDISQGLLREDHLVIGVRTPGLNKLGKVPFIYFSKTM